MILMSKYKGQQSGKKGKKIGQGPPPPFSGNARKKSNFLLWGVPLLELYSRLNKKQLVWLNVGLSENSKSSFCLHQNVSQDLISVHQSIKCRRAKWLSWIRNKFTIFQLCSSWACAEARQSLGSSACSRNSPCSSWKGNSALLINDPDVAGWE